MRISALAILFAIACGGGASANNDVSRQCIDLFRGSLVRVSTTSVLNVAVETVAKDSCSGSSFSLDAGFDSKTQALIDGVPGASSLLGTLGINSTKKLCEAYKSGRFALTNEDRASSEPVVEAMDQANRCIELASRRDVVIQHKVLDPGTITFGFQFLTTERQLRFTVQTTGGFVCASARPGTSRVEAVGGAETIRKNNFSITCERKPKVSGDDKDFEIGAVSINFGDVIYAVRVPADSVYGAKTRRAAEQTISEARMATKQRDDALMALRASYEKRTYSSHVFYFGEHDLGLFGGVVPGTPRYWCELGAQPQSQWQVYVGGQLCPGGTVKSIRSLYYRGGNKCGYTYFNMVCEHP